MNHDTPLATLLAAVARRDQAALRAVYDREGTRLFGVAMAILRDRTAAADAVQDAFLRVWERAGQFDPAKGQASAWLAAIVRYAALDAIRARGRETPTDDATLGDQPVAPEALERLLADEDGARLHDCLSRLDGKNRESIVMAFVHGLSHAQVAARLELPLGSVKAWIRRGLLSLKECLS